MSTPLALIGLLLLTSSEAEVTPPAPTPADARAADTQPSDSQPSEALTPAGPPPSQYDLSKPDGHNPMLSEEQSLLVQLGRTVLSLGIVVGLIYLIAKLVVPRLGNLRTGSLTGQLELLERLQLDPKHAVFLVQIDGKRRGLLGGGDGDLRLLTDLGNQETSFGDALEKVQKAAVDSTQADAVQDT